MRKMFSEEQIRKIASEAGGGTKLYKHSFQIYFDSLGIDKYGYLISSNNQPFSPYYFLQKGNAKELEGAVMCGTDGVSIFGNDISYEGNVQIYIANSTEQTTLNMADAGGPWSWITDQVTEL